MFFCRLLLQHGSAAAAAVWARRQMMLAGVAPGASVVVFLAIKLRESRHARPTDGR